jgi:hypothetical protein
MAIIRSLANDASSKTMPVSELNKEKEEINHLNQDMSGVWFNLNNHDIFALTNLEGPKKPSTIMLLVVSMRPHARRACPGLMMVRLLPRQSSL